MVGLKAEVLQELEKERAHWKGKPSLQVLDEEHHLIMTGGRTEFILGGTRSVISSSDPSIPWRRSWSRV